MERALVAFANGSGAWILYASGAALSESIDAYGRDADEVGLLRAQLGWMPPMRGLWVWEGEVEAVGVSRSRETPNGWESDGRWEPSFAMGTWRRPTPEEWQKIAAGDIALWPPVLGFLEPRS